MDGRPSWLTWHAMDGKRRLHWARQRGSSQLGWKAIGAPPCMRRLCAGTSFRKPYFSDNNHGKFYKPGIKFY